MATKVINLANMQQEKKELKPIEFKKFLTDAFHILNIGNADPSQYDVIEIICKNYDGKGTDLMFAYNNCEDRSKGILYIGHANDEIV